MKDFLTIKEFSKLSGIEQTTLRYWDEIGIFSPAKRASENNYRYYSPEQVITAKFITVLSDLDVPLKTIGYLGKHRTPEGIVRLIEQKEKDLDMELRRLRERYSIMRTRLELINYGLRLSRGYQLVDGRPAAADQESPRAQRVGESSVGVMHREDRAYILGPPSEFRDNTGFLDPFTRFCRKADELRINLNYPVGGYHESMETFLEAPDEPERFFSLDPTGNRVRQAGHYLVAFARGYYGELGDLPDRMAAYIKENSLTVTGPVYQIYLHDEVCLTDINRYLLQVCVAVT